jgi:cytochrome c556
MNHHMAALLAVLAAGTAGLATAAEPAPSTGAGWTGRTHPQDVILARAELMEHMEELMRPIDTIRVTPGQIRNVDVLRFNAEVVGAMLKAVPHLFPPTTNLYDPQALTPQTIALPAIWQNWESFYRLAQAASKSAEEFAQAQGGPALRAASRRLRASCDACHTPFLRKYEPPKVKASDAEFDFSSALPPKK